MPRYRYHCEECEHEFDIRHSMGDSVEECPECGESALERVLPHISYNSEKGKSPVGSLVKSSIKEAREAIEAEKKEATKEYEP